MRPPARFLTALAQSFSAMNLYGEGHPARERAIDSAFDLLQELQEGGPEAEFTFLDGEVRFGNRPLRELKEWSWSPRLSAVGVQRLQFTGPVTRPDLDVFLEDVVARMGGIPGPTAEVRQSRPTAIRFGPVHLKGRGKEDEDAEPSEVATATLGFTLGEEAEAVRWIHDELKNGEELHLVEAEAIVRSLSVAMHGDQQFLIPLLQLKRFDQYTTTHALNVSILGMALSEFLGLAPTEIRTFGISGLLHDLGKTRVPEEILNKPGKLTDDEREVMNSHTVEGARLIMEADHHLDLAAVVAYEHHIRIDGGGYPQLAYPRACHQCSNLIHVCDVYDALRTERPYRDAWEHPRVIEYIREGAGKEFDLEIATAFVRMMEQWEPRVAIMEDEDEPLPNSGEPASPAPHGESPEEEGATGQRARS